MQGSGQHYVKRVHTKLQYSVVRYALRLDRNVGHLQHAAAQSDMVQKGMLAVNTM